MNKKVTEIKIESEYIMIGQFSKFADIIHSGGEAKSFLLQHEVMINNESDNRRGRKLRGGDVVEILGNKYRIIQ